MNGRGVNRLFLLKEPSALSGLVPLDLEVSELFELEALEPLASELVVYLFWYRKYLDLVVPLENSWNDLTCCCIRSESCHYTEHCPAAIL